MVGSVWILRVLFLLFPVWCFAAVAETDIQPPNLSSRTLSNDETSVNSKHDLSLKGLDFESMSVFTLPVEETYQVPFSGPVSTSTATVDNKPPVFSPTEIHKVRPEDAAIGRHVVKPRAIDPDRAGKTSIKHKPVAEWVSIGKDTGSAALKSSMDRESQFVQDNKYVALAYDKVTGRRSLMGTLLDKNDHGPQLLQNKFTLCNYNPVPVQLDIVDQEGHGNTGPFSVELQTQDQINWVVRTNSTGNVAWLTPKPMLAPGIYIVSMRIYDSKNRYQDSTLTGTVCQCLGTVDLCFIQHESPPLDVTAVIPAILGCVFIALFVLLMLVLGLLLRKARKRSDKEAYFLDAPPRDNIFTYNEQGGGEGRQEFKLEELHRGLDNHPKIFRTDVFPMNPHPRYPLRPHHQDNKEVDYFIGDSLHIADSDPTAPPYDTLLVFDYGDCASNLAVLSPINSSDSDEDQDAALQNLAHLGPRFRKLADMYSGGTEEEDDTDTLSKKIEWV